MKSERAKQRITTIGLFLALLGETYYILYDIPYIHSLIFKSSAKDSKEKPIAQLISKKNEVRFQPTGELFWDGVTDQQNFFQNESVLTLDQARAEIAFLDGMGILVEENSLIQLEKNHSRSNGGQNITVKLLRGSIKKPKGVHKPSLAAPQLQGLELNSKNAPSHVSVTIQAGDLIAQTSMESEFSVTTTPDRPGGAKVQVQEGEVHLESQHGSVSLKKGEESTFVPNPTHSFLPTVRQSAFFLIAPKGGETLRGTNSITVEFSWKVNPVSTSGTALDLETSSSPDFSSNLHSVRIGLSTPPLEHIVRRVQLPAPSQPEAWYWRVKSAENDSIVSEVAKFWLQPTQTRPSSTLTLQPRLPKQLPSAQPAESSLPPPLEVFSPEIEPIPQRKGH